MKQLLAKHARAFEEHRFNEARASLRGWTEAVASGRIDAILALYASNAILVPTLTNEIIVTEDGRRRYFEFFLSDGGPECTVNREEMRRDQKLGTVTIGGHYTFCFSRHSGQETVPARFLYIFEEIEGRWLITGHHSSRCV